MIPAVALAAKGSGDSTGLWWVAIPSAALVLLVLVLVGRHAHRAPTPAGGPNPDQQPTG